MSLAAFEIPTPVNEPGLDFRPGSAARASLAAEVERMRGEELDAPMFLGADEVRTDVTRVMSPPHDHQHSLGVSHQGSAEHVVRAIDIATAARQGWMTMPFEDRAAIFLKAADLIAGRYRDTLNAATMLNQGKNCHQADIDAACELIDFLRFNVHFARQIYTEQPLSVRGMWNRQEFRPLDGFVLAITPFNFTAIAGNLPTAPAMMGNTVVWKPSDKQELSAHYLMEIFYEAGLPPGVINMVKGDPAELVGAAIDDPRLGGVHYTGSATVMKQLWAKVGANIDRYSCFPRFVGEAGGKDFVLAHESADPVEVATALVRGAFEYQGQKCSAASRAYVPTSIWPAVLEEMGRQLEQIKVGPPEDFSNFVNAVIAEDAFDRCDGYLTRAEAAEDASIVLGGQRDKAVGYFVHPTVIETSNPRYESMVEEIFGPILTVHPYEADQWEETLALVDSTSAYALTGAVFARERTVLAHASEALRFAAGNFYINDKPTGSIVGQQPFGGSRMSGTNDKAGSKFNLLRWVSPRAIKETFEPPRHFAYPWVG